MFTEAQKALLAAPLSRGNVKGRKQGGREVSYIEGWKAIDEANRIFGFDGWTRETIEIKCVSERERKMTSGDGWGVSYIARVRVAVEDVIREGVGAGHGIDKDCGQAHESAIKEAETDAMKRALMTFGNPFGLALYDKEQANVADQQDESTARYIAECNRKIGEFKDQVSLRTWWNSEEQKKARRDFGVSEEDLKTMMDGVKARLAKLPPGVAAA
jgi:DNA repair and recombination protein RAD52